MLSCHVAQRHVFISLIKRCSCCWGPTSQHMKISAQWMAPSQGSGQRCPRSPPGTSTLSLSVSFHQVLWGPLMLRHCCRSLENTMLWGFSTSLFFLSHWNGHRIVYGGACDVHTVYISLSVAATLPGLRGAGPVPGAPLYNAWGWAGPQLTWQRVACLQMDRVISIQWKNKAKIIKPSLGAFKWIADVHLCTLCCSEYFVLIRQFGSTCPASSPDAHPYSSVTPHPRLRPPAGFSLPSHCPLSSPLNHLLPSVAAWASPEVPAHQAEGVWFLLLSLNLHWSPKSHLP